MEYTQPRATSQDLTDGFRKRNTGPLPFLSPLGKRLDENVDQSARIAQYRRSLPGAPWHAAQTPLSPQALCSPPAE
jgi:hypothetical protein